MWHFIRNNHTWQFGVKIVTILGVIGTSAILHVGSLGTTAVQGATSTVVTLNAPNRVNPGTGFAVTISVAPDQQIAGLQLDLAYNSTQVDFVSASEGNLLAQNGNLSYFSPGTNASGSVTKIMGVITTPGGSISSPGTFVTINFTAKSAGGTCLLTLSNVIVGDKSGTSVPITIANSQVVIDSSPTMNSISNKSINEGQLLQFSVSASDPDNDVLTFSASNLPPGAIFNSSTKTFSWIPNYVQSGTYAAVTFTASDGMLNSQKTITITVIQPFQDWDVNSDGSMNVLDMVSVGQHWNETGTLGWTPQDINHDSVINVLDMVLIGQHWTG